MLQNYLKIAWRNLYRYPGYAVVTVAGLAIGIAGCLFVLLYLQDEQGFDRFHARADRTYRVVEVRPSADQGDQHVAFTAGILASRLMDEVPEVEVAVRLLGSQGVGRRTVSHEDRRFYEADYLFAEPNVFDVFDINLVRGNPRTVLVEPNTVVLTRTATEKYFGSMDPIGESINMEQFGDLLVTGVVDDMPSNSHLDFSMMVSYSTSRANERWIQWLDSWDNTNLIVYAVLKDHADPIRAETSLNAVLAANLGEDSDTRRAYLQPITDIHLGSGAIRVERHSREGDPRYIYIFSAIGLFLILIASINYMNMTTARSMRRAREIGMRKVTGGHRGQLVRQFLAESVLTSMLAIVIAITLVGVSLPFFNDIAGKDLSSAALTEWRFLIQLVVLSLVVGLLAGSYPAFFLSRLSPSQILSGSRDVGSGAARLRRGLVVAQFTLSIIMIVATTVVYNQMDFVRSTKLGFNENQLVVVDINNGDVRRDWQTVRAEFAQVPFVESVSTSSRVPGDWKDMTEIEVQSAGGSPDDLATMHFLAVDDAFLRTFEIRLVQGRDFSPDRADSTSVLLNESAARLLGITTPANQTIEVPAVPFAGQVIGIVEDFNYESLHRPVGPLVLGYWSNPVRAIDYFTARVSAGKLESVVAGLRVVGERFDPSHPFEYNVLDQRLQDFYVADRRMGVLFGLAAALAIFIACLGLAGLAAYTAERRTKEIGVRKVMGASVHGIVVLLSKDFVLLVFVAFVIAGPLSYLTMDRWLNAFAYKTDLSLSIFILSGAAALSVALITVSFQAIRSAVSNPIDSLRYE